MTDELSGSANETDRCRNCGLLLQGRYCHGCSQDSQAGSPSLFEWIAETFAELTSFEGRSFRSVRTLLTRPGELTVAWREGQRVRYDGPIRLFLVSVVVLLVLRALLNAPPGFLGSAVLGFLEGSTGPTNPVDEPAILALTDKMLRVFALALAPIIGGIVSLFFRRRPFSEHFVFTLHIVAFALLLRILFSFVELIITSEDVTQPIQILAILGYTYVAARRVYDESVLPTTIKLVVIVFLSVFVWVLTAAAIISLILRIGIS